MNLIVVSRSQVDANGSVTLSKRAQDHLKTILRSETGDIVRVGILDGQKGCAQLVGEWPFKANLLPLRFQGVQDVLNYLKEHPEMREGEAERASEAATEAAPEQALTPYIFPKLSEAELEMWYTNPYLENSTIESPRVTSDTSPWTEVPKNFSPFRSVPSSYNCPVIDIAMGVPRPRTFEKVLQYLASMSVGRLTFFAGSRSELAYFSSPKLSAPAITEALHMGLEQSCKTVPPKTHLLASWKTALDHLAETITADHLTLLAHPYAVEGFGEPRELPETSILTHNGPIMLIFGPERGFTDEEIQAICQRLPKVELVSMGADILRCEVAACALLAQCQLLTSKSRFREVAAVRQFDESEFIEPRVNVSIRGSRVANKK